ncbi:acetyltransferase [Streptomyces sp. NRRL F-4489]|nr:acetyltransferase [Streptomyces sp. NRRL F-4489]
MGKRVSVRRLTGGGAGEPAFTDAVGVLTSWDEGVLSITRRGGECVRIPESSLVAAKVVPAAPARRRGPAATMRELEEVAARGWPALETERLGEWTLRASEGFTRRANSALALGDPGIPLPEALDRVEGWYAARGLPVLLTVPTGDSAGERLAAELAARGWPAEAHTTVRTAPLAPLADAAGDRARVLLSREPDDGWLGLYHRAGADRPAAARAVLTGGPSVWFARVPAPNNGTAAIGRLVVDGRWAGFSAIETDPAWRRGGLATLVMAALAERALAEGASAAYLQVEADNAPALALYGRLGFTEHHGYHYRRGVASSAGGA